MHVDHDPGASRHAAHLCREAAREHERRTGTLWQRFAATSWSGCEREQVEQALLELCDDLRREAAALRATADELDLAAHVAEAVERDRAAAARAAAARAAAEAAAERAAPCPPAHAGPMWGGPQ